MKVPAHIDWFVWRVIRARYATLTELRESWTLLDVLDAHELLDLEEVANARTT